MTATLTPECGDTMGEAASEMVQPNTSMPCELDCVLMVSPVFLGLRGDSAVTSIRYDFELVSPVRSHTCREGTCRSRSPDVAQSPRTPSHEGIEPAGGAPYIIGPVAYMSSISRYVEYSCVVGLPEAISMNVCRNRSAASCFDSVPSMTLPA